jgi:hypothetical protein
VELRVVDAILCGSGIGQEKAQSDGGGKQDQSHGSTPAKTGEEKGDSIVQQYYNG